MATSVDAENLLAFFNPKKVKSLKLLYRASDYGFLVSKFHEKCDGIPHTLTVLKNNFNKIVGGYTPLTWQSTPYVYVKDESG